VVGEGMAAPLPKVAKLSEDGQIVGAEDEAEDEAVLAERRMIEGPVRCLPSSRRHLHPTSPCSRRGVNLKAYMNCVALHLRSGGGA
jgi:hypothetical protein